MRCPLARRRATAGAIAAPVLLLGSACGCGGRASPSAGATILSLVPLVRIAGEQAQGEVGFRFGAPRDVDGDGIADIAAGARFTDLAATQMGSVTVWSTDGGRQLAHWEGDVADGLFGHAVLVGPDADGDRLADVIAAAPTAVEDGVARGVVTARSPRTGSLIWRRAGEPYETFGWHLALAGDQNGDGIEDIYAGVPCTDNPGKVWLLSGRDGSVARLYTANERDDLFGWHVAGTADLDGDRRGDLLVGAPSARRGGLTVGAAYALSSADGRVLHAWHGHHANGELGQMVCGLGDLDGDGVGDLAVGTPRVVPPDQTESLAGEVDVFSGRSGAPLFHWVSEQPGELYGRMLANAGDLDGDGVEDIAIGAPWCEVRGLEKAGRVEVRSGRTGARLVDFRGDRADGWLGWHIERGEGLGRERRRGLMVSALRSTEGGKPGAGALIVLVPASAGLAPAHRPSGAGAER